MTNLFEQRDDYFSSDGMYRYWLRIVWDPTRPLACFTGLNPSKASRWEDDPTIRREKGFSARWGCGGLLKLNAFAYVSTDPGEMKKAADPIGPENTIEFLQQQIALCDGPVIACWGKHASFMNRGPELRKHLPRLQCLRRNNDGSPEHPLYIPYLVQPEAYAL